MNSVLANRITVVCQPVRVDTGRDVAVVAAYSDTRKERKEVAASSTRRKNSLRV